MSREIILSTEVVDKLTDLVAYLKDELMLSQQAASAYRSRFIEFISSLKAEVDHPLCRFKRWRELGYRCAIFEKDWVLAYQVVPEGVIIKDMSHTKLLKA